jgi:hypothetical protein
MSVPTSGRPNETLWSWYESTRRSMDPWLQAWAAAADDALTQTAAMIPGAPAAGWVAPSPAMPAAWWTAPPAPARGDRHGHRHHDRHHDRHHGRHHDDGDGCGCGGRREGRHDDHQRDCGCGRDGRRHDECGCDPCRTCVHDADLVVTVRPGERRIVPLELRNTWHRERVVAVAIGDFTADGCGPTPAWTVRGTVTPTGEVTIPPCSEVTLVVEIEIGLGDPAGTGKETAAQKKEQAAQAAAATTNARAATYYADLSLAGCGRAQRIAVVVLPETCGAHEITPSPCCCC